jgi:hypothetical protein
MKYFIFQIIALLPLFLNGQSTAFQYVFSKTQSDDFLHAIETSDSSYLIVTNQDFSGSPSHSAVIKLNKNGAFIKKLTFENDSLKSYINRLVPTSYGFLGVGGQVANQKYYLWLIKMDNQLNLISQALHKVPSVVQQLNVDIDRDSNVIIGGSISYKNYIVPYLFGAKVTKMGNLSYLKYQYPDSIPISFDPYNAFYDCMITMKDSARHVFFDGYRIVRVDSNFNITHEVGMPYVPNFSHGFYPTALRLTDTSYYVAGKGREITDYQMSFYFGTVTLKGRYKNFKMLGVEDKYLEAARQRCLDTTKNGNIYIGGTFNYPPACQNFPYCVDTTNFLLYKLDKQTNTLWKNKYGKDGLFIMNGLLATSDGGCLMYGYRYLKTPDKKIEAYLIKVDANGLMTSETAIPLSISTLQLSPNPGNGFVQAHLPDTWQAYDFRFFDYSGKLVKSVRLDYPNKDLDLSDLNSGLYIFQVFEKGQIKHTGKWVKQ